MIIHVTIKRHHNIPIDLVRYLLILFSGSSFHVVKPITFFRSPALALGQRALVEQVTHRELNVDTRSTGRAIRHPLPRASWSIFKGSRTLLPQWSHSISQGPLVETRSPLWIWNGQRDTRREAASMGLEAGELPDSPVPGPRGRGREHCLLGQPEHIPSPGHSQR